MAWNDLLANQMVSYTDAQGGGFILNSGQIEVTSNQCMTKTNALAKYNLNATNLSAYSSNQLVPKGALINNIIPLYNGIMTVGTNFGEYGYSSGNGSLNSTNIPLFGNAAIINTLEWMPNILNFIISGVPSNSPPTNWTTITIGATTYNKSQFNITYGNPLWYIQLNTSINPFGTISGATKNIEIV
jgi:hypothetical protein